MDLRLKSLNLVDEAGPGILIKNGSPRLADVTDGLSNTILYAESAGRPYLYRKGKLKFNNLPAWRVNGGGWARPASDFSVDGSTYDGVSTPGPCAVNCTNGEDFGQTVFPTPYYGSEGTGEAFSFHPTGIMVVFGDNSTHFISENISIKEFARMVTKDRSEVLSGQY